MVQNTSNKAKKVGIISDTHDLVRKEALKALKGVDLIVHAGDIGSEEVIEAFQCIAPIFPVRGNMDRLPWASRFPRSSVVEAGSVLLYVLHDLAQLDLDPKAAGFAAIISGHTHIPAINSRHGILYINPGSAGPPRFSRPASLAIMDIKKDKLEASIIHLT